MEETAENESKATFSFIKKDYWIPAFRKKKKGEWVSLEEL